MSMSVAAQRPLSAEQQAELADRLGRWRRQPLSPEELAELLPRITDPDLALAVGERLGMAGPGAIALILPLCSQETISPALIRALAICHHPEARDQLLRWLPEAGPLKAAVLEALSCWGNQIDPAIIAAALQAPGRAERLAGLKLLTFRSRSLSAEELLALCRPLLDDLRAEVVIATLRLLQRRQESLILQAIQGCIRTDALPGVSETALQALGCISSASSCELLVAELVRWRHTPLEAVVRRQLQAQVRHRHWLELELQSLGLSL